LAFEGFVEHGGRVPISYLNCCEVALADHDAIEVHEGLVNFGRVRTQAELDADEVLYVRRLSLTALGASADTG